MVSAAQTNWCEMTPFVTFADNCAVHEGTTFYPFYLMFLREPRVKLDLALERRDQGDWFDNLDDFAASVQLCMEMAYEIVDESMKARFDRMKKR